MHHKKLIALYFLFGFISSNGMLKTNPKKLKSSAGASQEERSTGSETERALPSGGPRSSPKNSPRPLKLTSSATTPRKTSIKSSDELQQRISDMRDAAQKSPQKNTPQRDKK